MAMTRRLNWPIWTGLLITIFALISYPTLFVRFPITRDFPWVNLVLFVFAAVLVWAGMKRAFAREGSRWAKISASIGASLSALVFVFFVFGVFVLARKLPPSEGAPRVGQQAPEFRLLDTQDRPVTLSELLSAPVAGRPTKGVLLVFYRGYW